MKSTVIWLDLIQQVTLDTGPRAEDCFLVHKSVAESLGYQSHKILTSDQARRAIIKNAVYWLGRIEQTSKEQGEE